MKLVNFIVPNYNNEQYLDDCLEPFTKLSKYQQNLIEVIIVDDKSTDNSIDLVNKYVSLNNKLFKLIEKTQNNHHGSAINVGIEHSYATWINFLDADDFYSEKKLSHLLDYLLTLNDDIDIATFGGKVYLDQETNTKVEINDFNNSFEYLKNYFNVRLQGSFYKLEIIENMIVPENYMYDDIYSNSYAWNKSKKISVNNDINAFNYRLNRVGQSVADMDANYSKTLAIHALMAYKCITEISENYYLRWHVNSMMKRYLVMNGCPYNYFYDSIKLTSYFNRSVEKLEPSIDFSIVAENMTKYINDHISPDFIKNETKLVNYEEIINKVF